MIRYVLPVLCNVDAVLFTYGRPDKDDASRASAQSDQSGGSTESGAESDVYDCLVYILSIIY